MRTYSFDKLVGSSITFHLLKTALKNGTFHNFSIFGGILGTGKSTSAGIVAMGLTCMNPVDGLPCLHCSTCRQNQIALEQTGESPLLKVVNLGMKTKFEDVESLIKDIFVLQGGSGNQVYVFEEAHALRNVRGGFTAFLAEIDRMPSNTYVIMCTTRTDRIPNDLKSRAVLYNFGRVQQKDGIVLANAIMQKERVRLSPAEIKMIVNYAKGIPREIEKLIKMAIENEITEEEMKSYLQVVGDAELIALFRALKESRLATAREIISDTLAQSSPEIFVEALKDFVVRVAYLIEGGITEDFALDEKAEISEIFNPEKLAAVITAIEKIPDSCRDADIALAVLRIGKTLQGKSMAAVISQKSSLAAKDRVIAERKTSEKDMAPVTGALTPLSSKSLDIFGGE
jgi:DNA polymerase III, gamma/tau subunits